MSFRTIEWLDDAVVMIDQTRLPGEEIYNTYTDFQSVAEAIRGMIIRGAPAIGVAAAMNRFSASWTTSVTCWAAPARRRSTSSGGWSG